MPMEPTSRYETPGASLPRHHCRSDTDRLDRVFLWGFLLTVDATDWYRKGGSRTSISMVMEFAANRPS
jgi:hypothetical protein